MSISDILFCWAGELTPDDPLDGVRVPLRLKQRQHLVAVKYRKFRGTATVQKGKFRGKLRQNLSNFAAGCGVICRISRQVAAKFIEFRGKLRHNLSNFAASCGKIAFCGQLNYFEGANVHCHYS